MARNRTLAQLLSDVRERANLRGSQPTDTAVTAFINAAIAWVWQDLAGNGWGYTIAEGTVTCTPDVATVALPATFAAMRHVRRPTSGVDQQYRQATFLDPAEYYRVDPDEAGQWPAPGRYWYSQGFLRLAPIPAVAEVVKLVFETGPPVLSDPADTYDAIYATDEPVIWYAAGLATPDGPTKANFLAMAERLHRISVKGLRPRDRQAQRVRGGRR